MAPKLSTLKKPKIDIKPLEDEGDNDTLWSEIASLDRLSEDKTEAAGDERDALKLLCEKHGLNAAALRLFRRVNKQEVGKQADFLRTWDMLQPRLPCKAQADMFEEGR